MKKRKIGFVYFFSLFTCGIYFVYWLLSLVSEINQYFNENKIKFKTLAIKLIITFIVLILIIQLQNIEENKLLFYISFLLGIYFLFLIISTLYKTIKYVYIIREIENIEPKINKEICLMMFLIFYSGIIILQRNINEISIKNTKIK